MLGGATYFEYYSEQEKPALPMWSGQDYYLPYNSAIGFYPDSTMQIYRKYNLVPIVERVPFVHALKALDVLDLVDWQSAQGYGKGYEADQFKTNGTKTPGLVCYDSVFPSWVRAFVNNGAGFITVITNDGWWGDTSGHTQHFAYARLRALEFRRWVVRSANNGISGVIAPDGSVKVKTNYWERTGFRYEVPILTQQTFYAQYGDWLPYFLLVISFTSIGFIFYKSFNSNEYSQPH
ncbi:MAG: apolipoprotein N-acyltransferase [Balneolaceae bacterium]|nr:apolipoprotein N-acyltransferase [Balneolaceae bacterium]